MHAGAAADFEQHATEARREEPADEREPVGEQRAGAAVSLRVAFGERIEMGADVAGVAHETRLQPAHHGLSRKKRLATEITEVTEENQSGSACFTSRDWRTGAPYIW